MPVILNFLARLCAVLLLSNAASAQSLSYVGSDTCSDCHADQNDLWKGSQHALAWTVPTPQTMLGDFNDAEFSDGKTTTRFTTQDDEYFVSVTEMDGQTTQYKVHSTAGIAPLQQYLLETEPGRQQSLDVVWDVENQGWYNLYPDQDLPSDDGLHWAGPYKNWNARCAECHATGYQRNFGARTGKYASTMAEMGVGCEACHGPGGAHVQAKGGKDNIEGLGEDCPVCVVEAVCTTCHVPKWDKDWDLDTHLPKVGHKN
jgi:hypothetical protein